MHILSGLNRRPPNDSGRRYSLQAYLIFPAPVLLGRTAEAFLEVPVKAADIRITNRSRYLFNAAGGIPDHPRRLLHPEFFQQKPERLPRLTPDISAQIPFTLPEMLCQALSLIHI